MRPFSARLPLLYRSMTAATSSSRVAMLTRLITASPTPTRPGAFQMRQQLNIREHFWRGNAWYPARTRSDRIGHPWPQEASYAEVPRPSFIHCRGLEGTAEG